MSTTQPISGFSPAGLRNFWYPVLPAAELSSAPVRIRRLGEDLVAWRDAGETPHLFSDRCAHRSAPLSMGTVVGDRIRCDYHGLEYDGSGTCRRVPYDRVDDGPHCTAYRARAYSCEERAGYLWAYIDDESRDSSDPVPPLDLEPEITGPDYEWFLTTVEFGADWLTVMENQTDPAHAPALHGDAPFFPPPDELLDWFTPVELTYETEEIPTASGQGTRPSISLIAPTPYQGGETARYIPPTLVKIPVAIPGTDAVTWILQFHTPVDETATLGYWCTSRQVGSDEARDQWLAQQEMFAALWEPVDAQDVRMCEALKLQTRDDFRLLPQDGGITRVKHLLSQLARDDR